MKHSLGWMLSAALLLPVGAVTGQTKKKDEPPETLSASTFAGMKLRGIGPAFMSGRIADIDLHPNDPNTCLLYTSPSPRDLSTSRMPSSA